ARPRQNGSACSSRSRSRRSRAWRESCATSARGPRSSWTSSPTAARRSPSGITSRRSTRRSMHPIPSRTCGSSSTRSRRSGMNRFAEARTRLESDDFQEAMANIRSARDEANTALAAKLNRALQDAAENVAHAKRLGSDARDAEAMLRQANERILRGEYDNAMDVVNNALERVESAKIIEKRFIDLTFKAETTVRNGRKFGIDMKPAEAKLAQAVQLRKSDFAEATRSAEEAYRLAWEATEAFAPSMRGFLDVAPARVNEWTEATLTVENEGKGAAKDVWV